MVKVKLTTNIDGYGFLTKPPISVRFLNHKLHFLLIFPTSFAGSFHQMPLRSSLKKPKNKEYSITSDSSSKRVDIGLGGEQTNV